jgi:hypothetical protein
MSYTAIRNHPKGKLIAARLTIISHEARAFEAAPRAPPPLSSRVSRPRRPERRPWSDHNAPYRDRDET